MHRQEVVKCVLFELEEHREDEEALIVIVVM